jgi:hypothetical protein
VRKYSLIRCGVLSYEIHISKDEQYINLYTCMFVNDASFIIQGDAGVTVYL